MKNKRSGFKVLDNGNYHAVRYIFDQGIYRDGKYLLKSGISSDVSPHAYSSSVLRTEGVGKRWIMWDDSFIHPDLSIDDAMEVIRRMDNVFNQMMINEGFNARKNAGNNRSIGREYYEYHDKNELVEIIKDAWKEAYKIAYESVTHSELEESLWIEEFKPRPGQDTKIINPLVDYFEKNDRASAQAHGGSGKTKTSYATSQIVCRDILKSCWKILGFTDNQANTIQLAKEFSLFYKGQTGKRLTEILIVGSIDQMNKDVLESWATVIPTSRESDLAEILTEYTTSDRDCAIFVVNASANKFLKITNDSGLTFKLNTFTIKDEIQQYSSENGTPKRVTSSECAVVNPKYQHLFGKQLALSATFICRDLDKHGDDPSIVFNDDIDKFGERIVDINEIEAREMGWICEKEGLIIPLPTTPEFIRSVEEKRPFELELGSEIFKIHAVEYVGSIAVQKYLAGRRSHILILVSFRKDVVNTDGTGLGLTQILKIMQEEGMLDPEYEILEGLCENGRSVVNKFNRAEKAIMVATRWVGVGQDTYKCNCTLPLYNPSSRAFSRQFGMRGDRQMEDKVSTLAIIGMEDRLEESIWYESMQNISNGRIPQIVSEAEFQEETGTATGSSRNPEGGTRVGNVRVVRGTNSDPVTFEKWMALANYIGTRTYIDANGNTMFSKIARDEYMKIRANDYIEEVLDLYQEFKDGKMNYLMERRKLQGDKFYISKFASKYNISFEESLIFIELPLKKIQSERKKIISNFLIKN
jgi:hypothetical protein